MADDDWTDAGRELCRELVERAAHLALAGRAEEARACIEVADFVRTTGHAFVPDAEQTASSES